MARTKSPTAQITVRVPRGVKVSRAVFADATRAAQDVIDSKVRFAALSQQLAENGIRLSADQLAELASGKKKAAPAPAPAAAAPAAAAAAAPKKRKGIRRRTVLTDAQRKEVVADLKGGATVNATAGKFKCSPQTVMIIKGKAGLVKKKTAKKKAAKRK